MRGRRPDAAGQAEKGNPGKRKKQPTIADRLKLLAEAPHVGDAISPPAMFGLDEFKGAIAIWNEYAPQLRRRNILNRVDRHTLAMFCYYLDRFWSAVATIAQDGSTQSVKTIAGGFMLRSHPAVRDRDDAAKIVFDLSAKFGFTPMDRHKLIREMVGTGVPAGGLFGDEGQKPETEKANEEQDASEDPHNILAFARRNASAATKR